MVGPPENNRSAVAWARLGLEAPEGLALADTDGRFVQINRIGAKLYGRPDRELVGTRAPFALHVDGLPEPTKLFDESPTEQVTTWSRSGMQREFAYRVEQLPENPSLLAVAFPDVIDERHRQRRVAAIARTSTKLAFHGSLTTTLDALASEVVQTDALAGMQIMTPGNVDQGLRIMGSAGFRHWPDFFDRLLQCRKRGAAMRMLNPGSTGGGLGFVLVGAVSWWGRCPLAWDDCSCERDNVPKVRGHLLDASIA